MSFSVTRLSQSFVGPSEPTPSVTLRLSLIDRVPGLRHPVRSLHVFKHGERPAKVIREALSRALVPYYPFAGRFVHDSDGGEVVVECTGEGAWFVEAAASCRLEEVRYLDYPLMISQEELLPQATSAFDPLNVPLMMMQVTEFKCGGFVVGIISIHTIADGLGAAQFINAIAELARGCSGLTVNPIWARHIIPNPPFPPSGPPDFPSFKLQSSAFNLPADYINQIKASYFHSTGHRCSAFDISVASTWQARTRAVKSEPETPVHVCFFANTRHLLPLAGNGAAFYGNCFYPVTVTATSAAVADAEVVDVVRMVREAKAGLPREFARWAKGEFVEDPYQLSFDYNSLFVSDWSRLGFLEVDYGWGKPVHVVPFAYYGFMAVAIFGAPPAPEKGVKVMTQCVQKEHLKEFQEQMKRFA